MNRKTASGIMLTLLLTGILTFSFLILTGVAMLIFGYLADKIVRKWILFCGVLIYSISSIFTVFVPSGINGYYMFFLITIVIGDEPCDKTTPSRLWPSDHAGVVTMLHMPDA